MGIIVNQARDINLSYRDRGNVIRITVMIIRIIVAVEAIIMVFLLIIIIAVSVDIKISARYSAIKNTEKRDP